MVEPRTAAVQVEIVGIRPVDTGLDKGQGLDKGLGRKRRIRPTPVQAAWLTCGLAQPGGKLPLFDRDGQRYRAQTIRSCITQGWAKPWFSNPIMPDWLVCRLTKAGRAAVAEAPGPAPNAVPGAAAYSGAPRIRGHARELQLYLERAL